MSSIGPTDGARTFLTSGEDYDRFMGRYSRPLSIAFADAASIVPGLTVLDAGCGPGALTGELVRRLGATHVCAFDPSPPFVEACRHRHPGVEVLAGRCESIPFADRRFDAALAQLVLHFVGDPPAAAVELRRVVRPGGAVAACVWDFAGGMQMLRLFWDSALALDPDAPDEARTLRFGRPGEIAELLSGAGLTDIVESGLDVESSYAGFDELWSGFLAGIGPAGSYCVSLDDDRRERLRADLFERLGAPVGGFTLAARARCAVARVP